MSKVKPYADEFCEDLVELFKNKYNFTIDDIYFFNKGFIRTLSRFTNEMLSFCYTFAQRRIEVEDHRSEQKDESFKHEPGDGTWNPHPYETSYKGSKKKEEP